MNKKEFWKDFFKKKRKILAPMVGLSDLSWRTLVREYGADLCYTPMFHSKNFVESKTYRKRNFLTNKYDRPLVVQFCSNDPEILLKAVELVKDHCDAVDLNLGCPQRIAKRGRYGSYLQDEWDLIRNMIRKVKDNIEIPISCKIRIFPNLEKTVKYAQMLEKAGCEFICVHGRTREQKGPNAPVNLNFIKEIKKTLSIPVIANGGAKTYYDIENYFEQTNADGVMCAYGALLDPQIFLKQKEEFSFLIKRYLEICKKNQEYFKENKFFIQEQTKAVRAHMFKLFKYNKKENKELNDCKKIEDLFRVMESFIKK